MDEQILELSPLEKLDEYYLPEEIEEEIIFPSNLSVPLTRKVTSSFSSPLTQRTEKMPALASNADDVFGNAQSKVNIRNQQSPIDSLQRTGDTKIVHRKRSILYNNNNPLEEKKAPPPNLSSNNSQSPKFIAEPEKYPSEKLKGAFSSKATTTRPPMDADQSNIKKSSLLSSSKVHSDRIVSSEGSELFPRKHEPAKQSSSTINASSRDITPSLGLNESKPAATTAASDSSKPPTSKVIAEDDNSSKANPQSEQLTNITKKILEPSTKSFNSMQPDAKIPIERKGNNNNSALNHSGIHDSDNTNIPHIKPIHIEGIAQTAKIAIPPDDKSLNLSDISQSAQDDSSRLSMSRSNTMNTSFASITPSKTKIDDHNRNNNNSSIIKPHEPSQTAGVSDRSHKPTITINKLDVHVVGSNNNNVQRYTLDDSPDSPDIHSHKLDFEDHQINTEILNKSYLWKYKVRLS